MSVILQLDSVSKYIGELLLFKNISLTLQKGDKAALLGLNGTGKSTLLDIITGIQSPDQGTVDLLNNITISYLPQEPVLPDNKSVIDTLFHAENKFLNPIRNYEKAFISGDVSRIEKAVMEMDRLKLWNIESRIKQILTRLSITDFDQKISELSGGQRRRVALAGVLLSEPDLLILDEPTNHLDLEAIEWLEQYLIQSSLTLLMVTHDRYFLNRVCNRILEIDNHRVYQYTGNYSQFVTEREKRLELEQLEMEKAENLLRKEEDWVKRMPKARGSKAKFRIDNYYRLKHIAGKRRDEKQLQLTVKAPRLGSKILVAKHIDFTWHGQYYVKDFSYTFTRFDKIGIIGNNGSGKSTLIEVLAGNLKPDKGDLEIGNTIKTGYFRQEGINFDENMKVLDAVTEIAETITIADNVTINASQFLNYFLFPPHRQHDPIYKLSGGEKRRLYLCQVLMRKPNFLILDEPTNDLDIVSLQVLEQYLSSFKGCVMIVSHDRYFIDSIADHLFILDGSGIIKDFPGNYSIYSNWIQNREKPGEIAEIKPEKEKSAKSKDKNKLTYKEKREIEQLETEILALETEKSEIETQLNSGLLSQNELLEKSARIGILLNELDQKTDRWLELSEKE